MNAVNLLPDRSRGGHGAVGARGGAYVVVGVLAALLVMALVYTLTANSANSKKTEAAKVKQEADQAKTRADALGAFGSFSSITTSRFDWERFMRELAAVLPNGSWVQDVNASATGKLDGGGNTAGGGGAAAGGSSATAAPTGAPQLPAAELVGCTAHQGAVADLMVRLRKLYLVSDVTLNSSERGEAAGAPSIENCGSYVKFDVSVSFSASAPTKAEVPEGHSAVPAKLGGGS
jgi:Tfp pilus assembly protein PilN